MRRITTTLAVVALLFSGGSSWADWDDGWAAYNRGDYATAFQEFLPYAEQGDSDARSNLGLMYFLGKGVPANNAKSYLWSSFTKAQGDENAADLMVFIKEQMTPAHIAEAQTFPAE